MAVTWPHTKPSVQGPGEFTRDVVVVGAGGFFGFVVVVGRFGRGAVVLSVPTGLTVGTVVVDAFEVLVLATRWPPQAPSETATATEEMNATVQDERNLNMRIAGAWICEWRSLRTKEEGQIPEGQRTPRCCAPERQQLLNPNRDPPALPRDPKVQHDRTKRPSRHFGR